MNWAKGDFQAANSGMRYRQKGPQDVQPPTFPGWTQSYVPAASPPTRPKNRSCGRWRPPFQKEMWERSWDPRRGLGHPRRRKVTLELRSKNFRWNLTKGCHGSFPGLIFHLEFSNLLWPGEDFPGTKEGKRSISKACQPYNFFLSEKEPRAAGVLSFRIHSHSHATKAG